MTTKNKSVNNLENPHRPCSPRVTTTVIVRYYHISAHHASIK